MTHTTITCSVTDCVDATGAVIDAKCSPVHLHRSTSSNQDHPRAKDAFTLAQLVDAIETQLKEDNKTPLNKRTVFRSLLERFDGNLRDLERFAYVDSSKNYTRNLISTDHDTYALILLVWNRGKYSPIHDHPCDGCWVKVVDGAVNEVQYQVRGDALVETSNIVLSEGVTYMDDSIGLHKIGNPSDSVDAITLHLYSPPYEKCRVWFDPTDATKSSVAYTCYFSEFGERADY